jgi:hypothetical protein
MTRGQEARALIKRGFPRRFANFTIPLLMRDVFPTIPVLDESLWPLRSLGTFIQTVVAKAICLNRPEGRQYLHEEGSDLTTLTTVHK